MISTKAKDLKTGSHFSHTSNKSTTLPISPSNNNDKKFAKKGSPQNSLPCVKGIVVQSLNRVWLFATPWTAARSEGNRRQIILQTDNCSFKCPDHILPQAKNHSMNNSNQNECSNKCFRLSSFRMINCLKSLPPRLLIQTQWRETSNFKETNKQKAEWANHIDRHLEWSYWFLFLLNLERYPVVVYGCKSWIKMKAERRRIDAFELWC